MLSKARKGMSRTQKGINDLAEVTTRTKYQRTISVFVSAKLPNMRKYNHTLETVWSSSYIKSFQYTSRCASSRA